MKKLFFASLFTLSATSLFAMEKESTSTNHEELSSQEELKQEVLKGNNAAFEVIINRNPKLSGKKEKLEENCWFEREMLGINLLPLYLECQKGNHCKKFIKEVIRVSYYKKVQKALKKTEHSSSVQ